MEQHTRTPFLAALAALLLAATPVLAASSTGGASTDRAAGDAPGQSGRTAPPPAGPDTRPQADGDGPQAATPRDPGPAAGTLSNRLSESGGVIEPPRAVDPGMKTPAPNPGAQSTPVIPPPGSPGGNPNVQPK